MKLTVNLGIFDAGQLPAAERATLLACGKLEHDLLTLCIDWDSFGLVVATVCRTWYRAAYDLGEVPRVWAPNEALGATGRTILESVYLPAAELSDVTACDVRLSDANLSGARLVRAKLCGAELRRADLTGANLARADLSRADLRWANLTGANLLGADLTGANLHGARMVGAVLPDGLSEASGVHWTGAELVGAWWRSSWVPPGYRLADRQSRNPDRAHRLVPALTCPRCGGPGGPTAMAGVNRCAQCSALWRRREEEVAQ